MFISYSSANNRGILDDLGNVNNAVFIFSPYKRLTKSYIGESIKVQRTSDNEKKWFGFDSSGNLKVQEILNWVGSNDGLVEEVSNQVDTNYNAIQTDITKMPKIVSSGVLESDGLLFDGVNDYMSVANNSDMNILTPKLSIFADVYTDLASQYGFIISRYDSYEYLIYDNTITFRMLNAEKMNFSTLQSQHNKFIVTWDSKATNGLYGKFQTTEKTATFSSDLLESTTNIGGRTSSFFYTGNIKTIIVFNSNEYNNYDSLKEGL